MTTTTVEGLDELIADLTKAPFRLQARAAVSIERAAGRLEGRARQFVTGLRHARLYPTSITHDVSFDLASARLTAEIGPDKNLPQGALGNLLEYGSINNAPFAHLGPALDVEGPRFEFDLTFDAVASLQS